MDRIKNATIILNKFHKKIFKNAHYFDLKHKYGIYRGEIRKALKKHFFLTSENICDVEIQCFGESQEPRSVSYSIERAGNQHQKTINTILNDQQHLLPPNKEVLMDMIRCKLQQIRKKGITKQDLKKNVGCSLVENLNKYRYDTLEKRYDKIKAY